MSFVIYQFGYLYWIFLLVLHFVVFFSELLHSLRLFLISHKMIEVFFFVSVVRSGCGLL